MLVELAEKCERRNCEQAARVKRGSEIETEYETKILRTTTKDMALA